MGEVKNLKRQRMTLNGRRGLKAIVTAALLVGTLDLIFAVLLTLLSGGTFMKLCQYIASGIFGTDAFQGGTKMVMAGVLFHYLIAAGWTMLFFVLYPFMKTFMKLPLLIGVVYGCFIWAVMNLVVLPLSNVPESPFDYGRALTGMLVLILAIGLPLAFMAGRVWSEGKPDKN